MDVSGQKGIDYIEKWPLIQFHLEANWSGSALFVIKYVNFYPKPGSSNLIGWKLEVGMAS